MSMIRVLIKEPGKDPVEKKIPNTLQAFQGLVGGYIEPVRIESDLIVICDEEGRLKRYPFNCAVDGIGFAGNIVIVGYDGGEDFVDCPLTLEELEEMIEL